jgi:hypothetical protein
MYNSVFNDVSIADQYTLTNCTFTSAANGMVNAGKKVILKPETWIKNGAKVTISAGLDNQNSPPYPPTSLSAYSYSGNGAFALAWACTGDLNNDVVHYRITITGDRGNTSIEMPVGTKSTFFTVQFTGSYTWWVESIDEHGASAVSQSSTFVYYPQ